MKQIVNLQTLSMLLPYLAIASLGLCLLLAILQFARLFGWYDNKKTTCSDPEVLRAMIRHENDLMNHRLTWLLTSQGLLFTALGFALSNQNQQFSQQLREVLAFVGILLAASASVVLDAANNAILKWSPQGWVDNQNGDVIGFRGVAIFSMFSPWRVYPPMFIIAWYLITTL
jgi:hypothetical protein